MRRCGRRRTAALAGPGRGDPMIACIPEGRFDQIAELAADARVDGFRERIEADPQLATLTALHKGRIAELPAKRLLSVSQHLAEAVPALVDAVEALPSPRTNEHP